MGSNAKRGTAFTFEACKLKRRSHKCTENCKLTLNHANIFNPSHTKQLIEETIRRNAPAVDEVLCTGGGGGGSSGGALTGSSCSLNTDNSVDGPASGDSALPLSARASAGASLSTAAAALRGNPARPFHVRRIVRWRGSLLSLLLHQYKVYKIWSYL